MEVSVQELYFCELKDSVVNACLPSSVSLLTNTVNDKRIPGMSAYG